MAISQSQVILLEDEIDLLESMSKSLKEFGLKEIICFSDTHNIAERIAKVYTKGTILVSDYGINPQSPTIFLPKLREMKINVPVVIISAKIKFNQLNQLMLRCRLAGYFEKGVDSKRFISDLAQHLLDLNQDALLAWKNYSYGVEARELISGYKIEARNVMRRIMINEDVKKILDDVKIHKDTLYGYRAAMKAFIGTEDVLLRFAALFNALEI